MAGRIEPGSGSGASTGHLGGSAAGFGAAFGGGLTADLAGVFDGALLVAVGRDRPREESEAGRCAEAVETQRRQASDAKTTLAANVGQARWSNRLGFIYTRRGEERAYYERAWR